jgi:hypothetical protein
VHEDVFKNLQYVIRRDLADGLISLDDWQSALSGASVFVQRTFCDVLERMKEIIVDQNLDAMLSCLYQEAVGSFFNLS